MINVDLCVITLKLNDCSNWAGQKPQTTLVGMKLPVIEFRTTY